MKKTIIKKKGLILIIGVIFVLVSIQQMGIFYTESVSSISTIATINDTSSPIVGSFSDSHFSSVNPIYGERPLLLILIEFRDQPHSPDHDIEHYNELLWGEENNLQDYFNEVSYGKFTYVKAGILGWYKSTCSINLYRLNFHYYTNIIARQGFKKAAQDQSFNFVQYDKNGDQIITPDELSIFVVVTNSNKKLTYAYTKRIDNKLKMFDQVKTWDGVFLKLRYCGVPEDWHMRIYAHELGHTLDLPDLYDLHFIPTGNSNGIGNYCVMNPHPEPNDPVHFCAWSKIKLGWIDPVVISEDGYYEIHDIERHPEAYIIRNPTHSTSEYFLVENRQRIGFDEQIPDTGIVIYHIDESRLSRYYGGKKIVLLGDNKDETHKLVDLECADSPSSHFINADDLDTGKNFGDGYDLWDKNEYVFHDDSIPCNSRWYDGIKSGISIEVLSESNNTMGVYFSINGYSP